MNRRRLILACLAAALLAAAGYSALWLYAARTVRDGLAQWTLAARAAGATVDYGTPSLTGYPFALRLAAAAPSFAAPGGRWRWSGDGVAAEVWPWSPRTVIFHPLGREQVSYPSAGGVETVATADSAAAIRASFDAHGRLAAGSIDAESLALTTSFVAPGVAPAPAAAPITATGLHAELTIEAGAGEPEAGQPPPGPGLTASADLALKIDDLTLPGAKDSPLGPHLSRIAGAAQLLGRIAAGPVRPSLAAWRDSGGTLEIKNAALAWGPLELSGNATVALDAALQPEGAATANISGFEQAIEALVAHGLVKPDTGQFLAAALTVMSQTQHGDRSSTITVPLSVQRQRLLVGPFKLMALPTVDWPG